VASILVIDDDEALRLMLREMLQADGHAVREAANGHEGLALYRAQPADLVITDIVMPEQDGMEVILELTREFLDARVIAMSGASGEHNLLSVAKLFGARHILEKPFGADQIRRLVTYTLAH